jgi:hypothetical protein
MELNKWVKASASNGNGNCVEVMATGAQVRVRDSKAKGAGPELVYTHTEWTAFLDGAAKGEFDL